MKDLNRLIKEAINQKYYQDSQNTAFTELVIFYQDMIYGYIYAIVRDFVLSEDLTQDVFIIAYRNLEKLRNYDAFPYWLMKIAKRECFKILKKNKKEEPNQDVIEKHVSSFDEPHNSYEKEEGKKHIHNAINKLPENQRITTVLYYINGYSQKDVANFLKINLNTVKKRLQRARENLKQELIMIKDNFKDIRPSKDDSVVDKISLYTTFDNIAKVSQLDILEQMIVDGIDINKKDAAGKTLLQWAVENNHFDAVQLLINNGALINIKDNNGKTALDIAIKLNYIDIIKIIKKTNKLKF